MWASAVVVESSRTRDQIRVACIGRQILNHWTTMGVLKCSPCATDYLVPHLSPSPQASLLFETQQYWPVNNPTVASKCSGEIKSYASLSLNQKLNMIKLHEEGISKTEIG